MNNEAAKGYMIIAARHASLTVDQIGKIETEIRYAMDEYTEKEAESVYKNF
jgi:hypothetical protein